MLSENFNFTVKCSWKKITSFLIKHNFSYLFLQENHSSNVATIRSTIVSAFSMEIYKLVRPTAHHPTRKDPTMAKDSHAKYSSEDFHLILTKVRIFFVFLTLSTMNHESEEEEGGARLDTLWQVQLHDTCDSIIYVRRAYFVLFSFFFLAAKYFFVRRSLICAIWKGNFDFNFISSRVQMNF